MSARVLGLIGASFLTGALVGPWVPSTARAQFRTVQTTTLMRTDLGTWCEGKEATVELQDFGAGTSGMHYHPAYSFGWVLEGSQVVTVRGKPPLIVRAGELLTDAPMEVSETTAAGPAKVLYLRIAEKGKPATVRVP